jgi:hypothetical protein
LGHCGFYALDFELSAKMVILPSGVYQTEQSGAMEPLQTLIVNSVP